MTTSNYMPDVVVEAAFGSGYATPAASRSWTDISAKVELDQLISIVFGRQDQFGFADPNILNLTLDNSDGRFTPNLASSPYYPNVKLFTPIRVKATPPGGSLTVRYVGYVTEWARSWDGTDAVSWVKLKAVSRLSRVGATRKLRSMVSQEILVASPLAYYPLGEEQGSTTAANVSTTSLESLTIRRPGSGTFPYPTTGPNVVFGNATGPAGDGASAVTFDGTGVLAAEYSQFYNNNVSVSAFVQTPAAPASLWSKWLGIFAVGFLWELDFTSSTGHIACIWGGTTLESANGYADGKWHHVAVVLTGGTTATLYVDGVSVASGTVSGDIDFDGIEVGGSTLYFSTAPFVGSVAHVAVLPTALTTQQISDIYALGMGTLTETAAARATRLANWGAIGASEVSAAGSTVVGMQQTTGKSLIDVMREVETTEAGLLYDERDGTLTFKSRSDRYSATVGLTLNMGTHQVGADFNVPFDPTFLLNDVTATGPTTSARIANDTSIDAYGDADKAVTTYATDDDEPSALAGWLVNNYAEPRDRVPNLTVDVLNCGVSQNTVAAATVGTLVQVTNKPSQDSAPTANYFVEGYTETFGPESWAISFNVSDAGPWISVWQLDSGTRSQLGSTTILAL